MKGIRLLAHPTEKQKATLSQWMGCARVIWNAKCEDERYMTRFARRYCPLGTYAPIDQTFSQYKSKELTPWLSDCPSQILRNSAVNWYQTYWKFIKGDCGKPRRKSKSDTASIYLTREVFRFERDESGCLRLFVGTKRNNIGYLSIKRHRYFKLPSSITIKRDKGRYYVSFCYGEAVQSTVSFNKANLKHLQAANSLWLDKHTVGIDRGITIPVQANEKSFDFSANQKRNKVNKERYLKRMQKKLSRQVMGSNRRRKTKHHIGRAHQKIVNLRNDFCHQTSHAITSNKQYKVIVLEDLKTKNMSKSAKGTVDSPGKQVKAKSGLNRSILDKGWHRFEVYLAYKAQRQGKALFKVSAQYTSQACADCGHTHPSNRPSQSHFECQHCGHTDNADRNAAKVIKKKAIKLILDAGTALSKRGVLTPSSDTGRGARHKSSTANVVDAPGNESSKKKRTVVTHLAA